MTDKPGTDTALYRIGAVASLTGLSTHTLRIWERRYNAIEPIRSEHAQRLYDDASVQRLRLLKTLVDQGHAISRVAPLSNAELERLIGMHRVPAAVDIPAPEMVETMVERILLAAQELNIDEAWRSLAQAWIAYKPRDFVVQVVVPMLQEVGERWERGEFSIAHEHAVSTMLRSHLGLMMNLNSAPGARLAVATTPAGQLHELGALLAALLAASHGWRVLYLGPNLPAAEIVRAAQTADAALVMLSATLADDNLRDEVTEVLREMPKSVRVVAGGEAAHLLADLPGLVYLNDLDSLERFLVEKS